MAPGAKHRNVGFAVQAPPCPATQAELQLELQKLAGLPCGASVSQLSEGTAEPLPILGCKGQEPHSKQV